MIHTLPSHFIRIFKGEPAVKLTETQKNFKKEMAKIKPKEKGIYDTTRSGNPFGDEGKARQRNSYVTKMLYFLAIPICSLLIPFVISHVTSASVVKGSAQVALPSAYPPSISVSAPQVSNITGKKAVSKMDNAFLDSFTLISNNSLIISKQNLIPFEQRDQSKYKAELLNAIVLCDNETKRLSGAKASTAFQPIAIITQEYIANLRSAYKYYLNYISTRNISDNDLGNKYLTMGNQNVHDYTILLTQIFKNNNYEYTDLGNGHWNYSVER